MAKKPEFTAVSFADARARAQSASRRRARYSWFQRLFDWLVVAAIGLAVAYIAAPLLSQGRTLEVQTARNGTLVSSEFSLCVGPGRLTCVVDGDTIWLEGTKIRVADIDTPEVSSPQCAKEKALGQKATVRLIGLVNSGPFQVEAWGDRDTDVYGRELRILTRNGKSLGEILVAEGLARKWDGARHSWCG